MVEEKDNNFTTTVRVKLDTYHKLEERVREKKRKNLQETGKVGDADFDGIINDLLNNNYQPKQQQNPTSEREQNAGEENKQ